MESLTLATCSYKSFVFTFGRSFDLRLITVSAKWTTKVSELLELSYVLESFHFRSSPQSTTMLEGRYAQRQTDMPSFAPRMATKLK